MVRPLPRPGEYFVVSAEELDDALQLAATGMVRTDLAIDAELAALIDGVADRRVLTTPTAEEAHRLRDLIEESERSAMEHEVG